MKKILSLLMLAMSLSASAQVTFESRDYSAVGVYDTWTQSPFRTGKLTGNVAVVDNPFKDAANQSAKTLVFQRSHYGSNTFGVRIDLLNTFELVQKPKYVHVLIYKPKAGRTMLIGLGKRKERAGQSREAEQFWVYSTETVKAGQWNDAVFPVNGHGGIDIYSLVVAADCESTHNLKNDFAVYVDDIVVNDDPTPRINVKANDENAGGASDDGTCTVTANNRNGDVLSGDGADLSKFRTAYGEPFKIKMRPSRGFSYRGVLIHYGQGKELWVPKSDFKDDTYTISGDIMKGDIIIDGEFTELK